jgi:hypothetical protein
MYKLHPEKQLKVTDEILRQIMSQYGIGEFSYEIIQGGLENTSILVTTPQKKYVLRIHMQGKVDELLSRVVYGGLTRRPVQPECHP